jgi:hypothetical protein
MRIQGLITGTVASVIVVALGGIAAIASHMSSANRDGSEQRSVPVAVASKPLDRGCAECGVIVAVRPIELKARSAMRYQIRVRMSDGSVKTLTSSTQPNWKAGDRVRLQSGRIVG